MSKKTVLIIGNYPPPFGGVPRHIERLVPHLDAMGWNVRIVSGIRGKTERVGNAVIYKTARIKQLYFLCLALVDVFIFPASIKRLFPRYFRELIQYCCLYGRCKHISRRNKIALISVYNLYCYAPVGLMVQKKIGAQLVVTNFGEIFTHREFLIDNVIMVNDIVSCACRLLAMSNHCGSSYRHLGINADVTVIPYGVDSNLFNPDNCRNTIRDRIKVDQKTRVILYLGRISSDMGIRTILNAIPVCIEKSAAVVFVVAGEKGDCWEETERLHEKFSNRVFIFPRVPFDELPLFYAAADIVIAPTPGERACGSLSSLEAMATGKAVIGAAVGGIPEIIQEGITGMMVKPNDSGSLADAILELSYRDDLARQFGIAGRKRVESFFDEAKRNVEIESLFASLV